MESVAAVRAAGMDAAALVLTSFHQSALPLALLLRLAGVAPDRRVSEDYPGSLLDVRHRAGGRPARGPERALHGRRRGRCRPATTGGCGSAEPLPAVELTGRA